MAETKYKLYKDGADVIENRPGEGSLTLCFSDGEEGYVQLFGQLHRLTEGKCTADLSDIPDGKCAPRLILEGRSLWLPVVVKRGNLIYTEEDDGELLRRVTKRERELFGRVCALEETVKKLNEKVFSSYIF